MKDSDTFFMCIFLVITAIFNIFNIVIAQSQPVVPGDVKSVLNFGAHGDFQYSPDGKYIAILAGREVLIWSIESKSCYRSIFDSSQIKVFRWRPKSEQIAIGNSMGIIRIININNGITVKEFTINNFNARVKSIEWSPDGKSFLANSSLIPDTLKLIDYDTGNILTRFDDIYYQSCVCFRWHRDGSKIAFSVNELVDTTLGKLRIYDINTKTDIISKTGSKKEIRDIAWSYDGKKIAGACGDTSLYVFDGITGELINQVPCPDGITNSVGWNPFNSYFFFVINARKIIMFDPDSLIYGVFLKSSCIDNICFDINSKTFAYNSCDMIIINDMLSGKKILDIGLFMPRKFHIKWNPGYDIIATCSDDGGTIRYWDTEQMSLIKPFGWAGYLIDIAYSPDGNHFAFGYVFDDDTKNRKTANPAGGSISAVFIRNRLFQEVNEINTHSIFQVYTVSWSPDNERIAIAGDNNGTSADKDYRISLSYYYRPEPYLTFNGHSSKIINISWSPDDSKIASRDINGIIKIWSSNYGKLLREFKANSFGNEKLYNTLSWNPDGRDLAYIAEIDTVEVKNLETSHVVALSTNGIKASAICWNPKGDILAVGLGDGRIILWDTKTWQPVKYLFGHFNQIQSLSWSGDGSRLASSDFSGVMRIWDLSVTDVKDEELQNSMMSNIIIKPNPASDAAYIDFRLTEPVRTDIYITDLSGSKVRQVFDGMLDSGSYTFSVDTGDLTAGSYFIQLKTNGRIEMRKMIITR